MWLEVSKTLWEIFSQKKKLELDRKERLSSIFKEISNILKETSLELSQNNYPHGKCALMESLSVSLIKEIKATNLLDEITLLDLEKMLLESSKLEKEFALRENPETILHISVTAGKIEALSLLLKI